MIQSELAASIIVTLSSASKLYYCRPKRAAEFFKAIRTPFGHTKLSRRHPKAAVSLMGRLKAN
jgi:hypothetical protein